MASQQPVEKLEEEERRARTRLAAFRAKRYRHDNASPMAVEMRQRELERKWRGAANRLRRAHRTQGK